MGKEGAANHAVCEGRLFLSRSNERKGLHLLPWLCIEKNEKKAENSSSPHEVIMKREGHRERRLNRGLIVLGSIGSRSLAGKSSSKSVPYRGRGGRVTAMLSTNVKEGKPPRNRTKWGCRDGGVETLSQGEETRPCWEG